MKQFYFSLCEDPYQLQIAHSNSEQSILPFDFNDLIAYVQNLISEYKIIKGNF